MMHGNGLDTAHYDNITKYCFHFIQVLLKIIDGHLTFTSRQDKFFPKTFIIQYHALCCVSMLCTFLKKDYHV